MTDGGPTVLIVDDEPDLAALYARYLSEHYRVRTASSGAEALEMLGEPVDVVLLDRRMPGLSGDEVLEEISRRGYDCRVAMVTAVKPRTEIVDYGIEDYLVKPIGRDELVQTVAQLTAIATHGELVQEFVELSMKQAALEAEHDERELERDADYRQLNRRIGELSTTLGDLGGILSESDLELFLEGLVRRMAEKDTVEGP
ncbi:response regulator [Salinigranum sp. GCM10025319]|uniref:response regulator n=1 Tax=Salinigranum sp. GCM10025319 TaxID=3252687 RepID=UPI003622BF50